MHLNELKFTCEWQIVIKLREKRGKKERILLRLFIFLRLFGNRNMSLAALGIETAAWYVFKTRLKYKGNTRETNIIKYDQVNCGNIADTNTHAHNNRNFGHRSEKENLKKKKTTQNAETNTKCK